MVVALSISEKNQNTINQAIREVQQGRNNAGGVVTLAVSPATSTTVPAPTCSATCRVHLTPQTANAAAAVATTWVVAAKGQFVINHAASAQTDRTFGWDALGGN